MYGISPPSSASDADAEPLPIRPYTFFRPMLAPLVLTFFVTFPS